MRESARRYRDRGRKYLSQASVELDQGDFAQASEKGWGAAAQFVKAAAEERGWTHGRHNHLFRIVRQLAEEIDNEELRVQFGLASDLHTNYYEEHLDEEDVRFNLDRVRQLVTSIDSVLSNGA